MRAAPVLCTLAVACVDATPPAQPAFEITNVAKRLDPSLVNAHVYGSFRVDGGGTTPAAITSGPANFPGAPKAGPGTCLNGRWYNSQGKPTTGSLSQPHPHCIKPSASIELVLEPISACYTEFPSTPCPVGPDPDFTTVRLSFGQSLLEGYSSLAETGTIFHGLTGYAIDATTLGTTNKRVGTLTIAPSQYSSLTIDYLPSGPATCTIDPTQISPCINKIVSATYTPLPAPDGLGPSDASVAGYLWITPASAPYNYRGLTCIQIALNRFGTLPPFSEIGSVSDLQDWCVLHVTAAEVAECLDRFAIAGGLRDDGGGGDPCLSTA
jgi:hypothetical protein